MEQTYVQRLAGQFLTKVIPLAEKWGTAKDMLVALTDDEWLTTLSGYRQRIITMLEKVKESPEVFGMVRYNIDDAVHEEELKSQKSFTRLPRALVVLGKSGEILPDGSLFCSIDAFKDAKITRLEALLEGITTAGWVLQRQNKDIILSDPDFPNIFYILKEFSYACDFDAVLSADIRWLQYPFIHRTPEDFIRLIPAAHLKKFITTLCEMYESIGYCVRTEYGRYTSRILISKTKSGKEVITMNVETDGRLILALRLSNIADYTDVLETLSPGVLHRTLSGANCGGCGWCNGPICFTYRGESYCKCSILYNGFTYTNPTEEDIASLWKLIACEWKEVRELIDA